jgi:site-specific recombinase XerD
VVKILQNRLNESGNSEWVFSSYGKTGHLMEPKTAWARIIKRAGLSDVRPHDLRRSLASHMAMAGVGLPIIGKMLGHTQPSTTAIYARLQTESVKDAAEKATKVMLDAGGIKLLEHSPIDKPALADRAR